MVNQGRGLCILIVDDEPLIRRALARRLKKQRVALAGGPDEVHKLLAQGQRPDVVLTDYDLGAGRTGLEVVEEVWRVCPEALIYIITGEPDGVPASLTIKVTGVHCKGSAEVNELLAKLKVGERPTGQK